MCALILFLAAVVASSSLHHHGVDAFTHVLVVPQSCCSSAVQLGSFRLASKSQGRQTGSTALSASSQGVAASAEPRAAATKTTDTEEQSSLSDPNSETQQEQQQQRNGGQQSAAALDPDQYARDDGSIDWATALKDTKIPVEVQSMETGQIKDELVDLLPRMTGTADEFRSVENYINALEDKYVPIRSLNVLNAAMGGGMSWRLLFSTNRLGVTNAKLRLRELVQNVAPGDNLEGSVVNVARWDLSENGDGTFDASGTMSVKCGYGINSGGRMTMELREHVLELAKGSSMPSDPQGLVGMLGNAMPSELFDPDNLAMDTTFLDGDLRIVRMTGDRFEGVRNVFVRSREVEVDPTEGASEQ